AMRYYLHYCGLVFDYYSLESEYNSASNLENNSVLMDDLEDNDASVNSLENKDEKPDDAKKAFGISNIQYAYGDPGTIRSIQKCPFLGVPVQKTYHSCLSIKVCEFSSTTLDVEHTSVNFEDRLYKKIFDANEFSVDTFTLNVYGQAYNTPCSYIDPNTNIRCNGNPILREYKQ
ncbi:7604_t:CDS:2, partial [Racocetra persica]